MGPIARAQNWPEAPIPDVGEHTGNLVEWCRKHERPRHEPAFSGPAYLLQPYCSRCSCRGRSYPRAYCNRTDTGWCVTDTRLAQSRRKPPKQAQFPDTVGRARTCSCKLVAGAGVSGSSPLVGSSFYCDLQVKREVRRSSRVSPYCNRTATRLVQRAIHSTCNLILCRSQAAASRGSPGR